MSSIRSSQTTNIRWSALRLIQFAVVADECGPKGGKSIVE